MTYRGRIVAGDSRDRLITVQTEEDITAERPLRLGARCQLEVVEPRFGVWARLDDCTPCDGEKVLACQISSGVAVEARYRARTAQFATSGGGLLVGACLWTPWPRLKDIDAGHGIPVGAVVDRIEVKMDEKP